MTSDADRIIGLYRRHAARWGAARGDRLIIEGAWLDRFLALVPGSGRVLDLGCGTGRPIARTLIERGRDVTGIDSAPEMIAMCGERFPGGDWRIGDMRTISLERRFDGVLAWDSFFHLSRDDQRLMFPVFRRHAVPGAALMFTTGPSDGEAIGTLGGEPLYHASLDPAEYNALLDANGFCLVGHVAEDPACGGHTVWLAQATARGVAAAIPPGPVSG